MFQEILTYSILLLIAWHLINKAIHFFKKPSSHCQGCFAEKNGCKGFRGFKRKKGEKLTELQIVTTKKLT